MENGSKGSILEAKSISQNSFKYWYGWSEFLWEEMELVRIPLEWDGIGKNIFTGVEEFYQNYQNFSGSVWGWSELFWEWRWLVRISLGGILWDWTKLLWDMIGLIRIFSGSGKDWSEFSLDGIGQNSFGMG